MTTGFRFIDLFAGIGGIRLGFEAIGGRCIFSCEIDKPARETYAANHRDAAGHPFPADITTVRSEDIPEHDVLLAGFPCQPFSKAGVSKRISMGRKHGFEDETKGTLFFHICRILQHHKPKAFFLENVKNLMTHDEGRTFEVIRQTLTDLGYDITHRVIDAKPWVPQHRERTYIVGFLGANPGFSFDQVAVPAIWPTLRDILDPAMHDAHVTTPGTWRALQAHAKHHADRGNGFGFGLHGFDDVARTLSARYYKDGAEILIRRGPDEVPRRLSPDEARRLMGFPEGWKQVVADGQAWKQFGNSVVVPVVTAIAMAMRPWIMKAMRIRSHPPIPEPIIERLRAVAAGPPRPATVRSYAIDVLAGGDPYAADRMNHKVRTRLAGLLGVPWTDGMSAAAILGIPDRRVDADVAEAAPVRRPILAPEATRTATAIIVACDAAKVPGNAPAELLSAVTAGDRRTVRGICVGMLASTSPMEHRAIHRMIGDLLVICADGPDHP